MRILLILALTLASGLSMAQELSHKDKIIDHIGQDRFDKLSQNNSPSLLFMNERVEMGYSIVELEDEKSAGFEKLDQITFSNLDKTSTNVSIVDFLEMHETGNLNILRVQLAYSQSGFTYYKLGNTGKVLVLHSVESITKSLNNK
ncbi:MAG: hypothetical protein ABJG68_15710 [Crocinitomicaceae bacterium]